MAARARQRRAGVLRVGWAGSPDSLNPGVGVLAESYILYTLVYDSLYEVDATGAIAPGLAARSEASAGRPGVALRPPSRWSPSTTARRSPPATSSFSCASIGSTVEFPYLHGYTDGLRGVEALGDTVGPPAPARPLPNLAAQLVYLFVLPEHLWAEHAGVGAAEFANAADDRQRSVPAAGHRAGRDAPPGGQSGHPWAAPRSPR